MCPEGKLMSAHSKMVGEAQSKVAQLENVS